MGEFTNLRERLPGILRALAVGIPAGHLFHLLQMPVPWMIGPMIAVAVLNLAGVRRLRLSQQEQMIELRANVERLVLDVHPQTLFTTIDEILQIAWADSVLIAP